MGKNLGFTHSQTNSYAQFKAIKKNQIKLFFAGNGICLSYTIILKDCKAESRKAFLNE